MGKKIIKIGAELDRSQVDKQLQDLEKTKRKIKIDVNDGGTVNNTTSSIRHLNTTAKETEGIFGKVKTAISNTFSTGKLAMTSYLAVLNEINKAGREAKKTIEDIDKAITDLQIATDMSRESVEGLVKSYNDYGKQLSATTVEVSSASNDYLRAGKTLKESQELIKDSIMLSKLSNLDSSDATEDLLAVMNGYEMSVDEVSRALDVMIALDMEAATSAGDIATALKYSASSADAAGLSFDKLASIIAEVQNKTQQSSQVVGSFMNTVLSRYRDIKLGNFISSEDGEDISDYESVLKSVGIQLRNTEGEFRDFEDVLHEMATAWDSMSSVQQAALAKVASGTRQQNRFYALMSGYNKVLELTEVAASSAGVAVDKYTNSYLNSLDAQKANLQTSFESAIINTNLDEVYSDIISATTALVEFIDKTQAIEGVMSGMAVGIGVKGFLSMRTAINEAYINLNKFNNALSIAKQTEISTQDFDRLLLLTNNLSDSQMKMVLSSKSLSLSQKELLLVNSGLSVEEAKLKLQTLGLATAQTGLTAATTSLSNAFKGLLASMVANPILLVTTAISGLVMAYQSYSQKLEEIRQKNLEASESAIEEANSIKDLYNEYNRLASIQNRTTSQEEDFKQAVEDITKALGTKADVLSELTAGTEEYAQALAKVTKEELQSSAVQATVGRKSAEEELQSDTWGVLRSKVVINSGVTGVALGEAKEAMEIVSDVLEAYEHYDGRKWDISSKEPEAILEYYNKLVEAREKLVTASRDNEGLLDTQIYKDINSAINTMTESLDTYIEKRYEEEKLIYMSQNGIPKTVEEYEAMKVALMATAESSEDLQNRFVDLLTVDFSDLASGISEVSQAEKELVTVSSEYSALSEENIKALNDYKSNIEEIASAMEDIPSMDSGDITSLITNFSQYASVFERFGVTGEKGVGDLEGALRELAEIMLSVAKEACPQLEEAINAIFSEAFSQEDVVSQLETDITELEAVIDKMTAGQALNASEVARLINKYGDLNDAVIVTTDGYRIELEALADLKDSKIDESRTAIAFQIEQTEKIIEQIGKRIKAYELEQEAVEALVSSYSNGRFSDIEDYISVHGEKVAEDNLGSAIVEEYNQYIMDKVKRDILLKGLEELKDDLYSLGSSYSSGGSSSEPTVTIFDWIETRIERTEEIIDRLQKKVDSVSNVTSQNVYIDEMFTAYKEQERLLEEARDKYMEYADAVGLSASYIEKIKNGTLEIEKITNETVKKKISEYQEWYDKAQDVEASIQDIIEKTQELNRQKLDNLVDDYERVTNLADSYKQYHQLLLDIKSAKGDTIEEKEYNSLMQKELDLQATLLEQYEAMEKQIAEMGLSPSSDEYYERQKELVDLKIQIEDCTSAVEGFKDSVREIRWNNFKKGMSLLDDLSDEITDVVTLLGDGAIFENGELTDLGMTKLGLYAQQYTVAKQQIAEYQNAIKSLNEMYRNGACFQEEYNEKLLEFRQASRDAALSVKDMREEMIRFNREAIEAQIDDMKELIETKKDLLDEELSNERYRQSILEKQKNISILQRQIDELSSSSAREDIAMRRRLESELAEAQRELEQEQYEHSIEQQKKALDEEYEKFKKEKEDELDELDSNLDKQENLIEKYLDRVVDDYDIVYDNIQNISDKFGLEFTDSLISPWKDAQSAAEMYEKVVGDVLSQININTSAIGSGLTGTSMGNGNTGNWIQTNDGRWRYMQSNGSYLKNDWLNDFGNRWYSFDTDGYMHENQWLRGADGSWYYVGSNGAMCTGWNEINGKHYYLDTDNGKLLMEGYTPDGYYVDENGEWNGQPQVLDNDLIQRNLAHYAKGTHYNPEDQYSIVDEYGPEIQLVPGKNGRVEYVKKGTSIIPADMSKVLTDFAVNPNKFIEAMVGKNSVNLEVVRNSEPSVGITNNAPLVYVTGGLDSELLDKMHDIADGMNQTMYKQIKTELKRSGCR